MSREVFRFDADAYCIVFCLPNSGVVQMTSNLADARTAEIHAEAIRKKGGHVLEVCSAGVLVAALKLIKTKPEQQEKSKDGKRIILQGVDGEGI